MTATNLQKLDYLNNLVTNCRRCPLYKTATHGVPGAGNPNATIVLIGEAPGFHEDQEGLPFVGASGKLLNKLLLSIGLDRSEVYIANILKHRPPDNRDPLPTEILACTTYLKAQLEIIKPKIVITLGRFAMNYFFPSDLISRVHGQVKSVVWHDLALSIFPVYHPSAALRNGNMSRALSADFETIGQYLKINL
jgi:DNA polymerase